MLTPPRKSISPHSSSSSVKKRPVPQPRRTTPPSKIAMAGKEHSPSPAAAAKEGLSLKSSLKSLLPGSPQVVPVPGANFVSYKRVVAPPTPAATTPNVAAQTKVKQQPEYVNTTPPAIPARNPNTSISSPRPKASVTASNPPSMGLDIPLPTCAPPPRPDRPPPIKQQQQQQRQPPTRPGVVLRSKSSSNFGAAAAAAMTDKERRYSGGLSSGAVPPANRHGLVLVDPAAKSSVPYYVADVSEKKASGNGGSSSSPEKQWIDSLRRREHPEPEEEDDSDRQQEVRQLKSAQSYLPMKPGVGEAKQQQQSQQQLKYVFDLDMDGGSIKVKH